MSEEARIFFMHSRMIDPENHEAPPYQNGGFTVAWRYNKEKQEVLFTLSICSPKDKFSKPRGRFVATKRLEDGRTCGRFPLPVDNEDYDHPRSQKVVARVLGAVYVINKDVLGERLASRIPAWFNEYEYRVPLPETETETTEA